MNDPTLIKSVAEATLRALGHEDYHPIPSDLGPDLWGRVQLAHHIIWLNSRLLAGEPWQVIIMVVLHEVAHVRAGTSRESESVQREWDLMLRPQVLESILMEVLETDLIKPPSALPPPGDLETVGSVEQT